MCESAIQNRQLLFFFNRIVRYHVREHLRTLDSLEMQMDALHQQQIALRRQSASYVQPISPRGLF